MHFAFIIINKLYLTVAFSTLTLLAGQRNEDPTYKTFAPLAS